MQSVAVGWLIYEITRSASWLGIVAFASNAPSLFLGLVGGALADRTDHKTVLLLTQAAAAMGAFFLAGLSAAGVLRIWHIVAIAIVTGTTISLYMPVVQAMIPSLVPPQDLLNAVSLNSVQFNLARIIGPLVAGFSYGIVGPAGCFFINGLSFLVLLVAFFRLRLPPKPIPEPASIWNQLADGLRYVRFHPLIRVTLTLAAGLSLFGFPYLIFMPAIARDALNLGPDGLGLLMGSVGFGAVVGGLGLASFGNVARKALLGFCAAVGLGILLIAFSLAPTLKVAAPLLFGLGLTQVVCMASLNTTLQVSVLEAMRGRVMSMLTFALFGLSTLGGLALGVIGDHIGVPSVLRLGGGVILALVVLLATRVPEIFLPVSGPLLAAPNSR